MEHRRLTLEDMINIRREIEKRYCPAVTPKQNESSDGTSIPSTGQKGNSVQSVTPTIQDDDGLIAQKREQERRRKAKWRKAKRLHSNNETTLPSV